MNVSGKSLGGTTYDQSAHDRCRFWKMKRKRKVTGCYSIVLDLEHFTLSPFFIL